MKDDKTNIKLKFEINKDVDKKVFDWFLKSGSRFHKIILDAHPSLKKDKKSMSKYVDTYYEKHINEIKEKKGGSEEKWRLHEDYFFTEVSKLFNQKWPKGKYIAYLSIWNIFPRWIKNKTFTISHMKNRNNNSIIVHELLHFMFYKYVNEKFPKISDKKKWHLSEIFNIVLMNQPFLKKIYNKKQLAYSNHKKYIPRFNKLYKKYNGITNFIEAAINEINKINTLS